MWLMATVLENTGREYFHHCRSSDRQCWSGGRSGFHLYKCSIMVAWKTGIKMVPPSEEEWRMMGWVPSDPLNLSLNRQFCHLLKCTPPSLCYRGVGSVCVCGSRHLWAGTWWFLPSHPIDWHPRYGKTETRVRRWYLSALIQSSWWKGPRCSGGTGHACRNCWGGGCPHGKVSL